MTQLHLVGSCNIIIRTVHNVSLFMGSAVFLYKYVHLLLFVYLVVIYQHYC